MKRNNIMSRIKEALMEITDEFTYMSPDLREVLKSTVYYKSQGRTYEEAAKAPPLPVYRVTKHQLSPVKSFDPHHPSAEEQQFYLAKKKLNPEWRPRCLDCGTPHPMIRCQNSYHCSSCKTERTHSMALILKHCRR
jgi:hypothetical protein